MSQIASLVGTNRNIEQPIRGVKEPSPDSFGLFFFVSNGVHALCACDNIVPVRAHFFKLYDLTLVREKEQAVNEKVAALLESASLKFIS